MTIRGRHLDEKLRGGLGSEWFVGPHNFMPMPLISGQPNTSGWVMAGPRPQLGMPGMGLNLHMVHGMPDAPVGAIAGAPGHDTMAIVVNALSLPATYVLQGTRPAEFGGVGTEALMAGARRLGFMVADANGVNPTMLVDVHGRTNLGKDVVETIVLTGLTNIKQDGWISWADNFANNLGSAGVAGAWYNPNTGFAHPASNSLVLGTGGKFGFNVIGATNTTPIEITTGATHFHNTGDHVVISNVTGNLGANTLGFLGNVITKTAADKFTINGSAGTGAYAGGGFAYFVDSVNWARLPLMPQFQTKNAWSRVYKIVVRERSGHTTDTLLVPCWNTIDFGLRTRIDSPDDIEEGVVLVYPYSCPFAGIPGLQFEIQIATTVLYPLYCEVAKRAIKVDPQYNVVSFTNTLPTPSGRFGVFNPHVINTASSEFGLSGEMPPGFFDWCWELRLKVKPGKKAA